MASAELETLKILNVLLFIEARLISNLWSIRYDSILYPFFVEKKSINTFFWVWKMYRTFVEKSCDFKL